MIININNPPLHAVEISRQGENEFREIVIDVSEWLAEYPDGKISVIYCRPDGELYPVIVNAAESPIIWRPTATDTAVSGVGAIEVRIQIGDVLGKSCTIAAKVLGALGAPGGTPAAPAPDWAQQVNEDADRAEAAAEKAEAASTHMPQISASKTWLVWDANEGEYVDTGVSAAGEIPEVDDTLTQPGQPADAAKVGEKLRSLSEEMLTEENDPTVPDWAKAPAKPSYTASEVGADPAGAAVSAVSQHNTDETAHNDLRIALQELSDRINAALDSDDTTLDQMSEVVVYIKSNKSLIDAITTSKVSVADIVNDLVTNVTDKPLSAAQGVIIKTLIDALRNDKLDVAELTNAVNTALAQAKESGEFDGQDGKSAYQYAQESGYTGTETEFAAKLAEDTPAVDSTLTVSGAAADANETGNRLSALSGEIVDQQKQLDALADVVDRAETLVPDAATAQNQLADKLFVYAQAGQVTPLFANSTDDCTDTTKVYVLPDGYIYGYTNGAWTNTGHQFTNAEALEKVIDATCDIETISGGNYNLLKVSEVSYSSRLQDNAEGIVASTATNIVTGWIPVRQGKYYAVSALVDGIKDAAAGDGRNFIQRINVKKADGTILVYNRYPTELCTELIRGKAYSAPADATHMMFHIQIQDRTPQSLDISTSAKLKAFEPMIVEGDTAVLAVSNSIDFAYVDGDEDIPSVVNYALKHDPYVTSALFSEQTDVAVTKIGAEIGRSLTTAGSTNPNPASVTTAFLINRPGATITVSSNAYRFQVSEFSAKSDSALVIYSGVIDYGTTFTTGASPYVRIAIRNADGNTADLNILDNIIISASEQSNFVSTNRRMDDFEYRLRSVEDADASPFKRDVDYGIIPTSYYKGVGTNYTTTFNADTQYASFMSAWDALISAHGGYVTKTNLGLCSDESQSLYLYTFKPVRIAEQLTPTPKVIITAGQHGNEKANVFGLYYFVDNLLNNWFKHPALEYLRTNVELLIVPVVNPSGFNNKTYKNSNGVNINRNYDAGWVLVDDPTSDQYGGAEPFDQPESRIIRDLILDNLDASLAIDYHVCSSEAAASLDVMTYYGVCPTNDKYYKRMIDVVAHQLTAISTNFNHDYSLGSPDTLSGYILIYSGAGILRQWVTDQNVIGVLVEGLTGLPNQTAYAANAFKANEELLVNYMITALNYLKG